MADPLDHELLETQARLAGLGVLAAGIAHELSNPLGFLKSNTDFVLARLKQLVGNLGDDLAPEVRQSLQEFADILGENVDGIRRMTAISSELRLVARSMSEARPCDVEEALDRALVLTHNLLKYKAEVERDFSHPPAVLADEGRLAQVFVNLLGNAAQAIEDRGRVTIRTRQQDQVIEVAIADTGCGIAHGNLERIFKPFFTTKPAGVGTGLGLWMVRKHVEEIGGTIDVASEEGVGTTFTVRLPVPEGGPG
ncbi:MAG: hypothetical protein ISR64_04385 [Deltaproteobacteria bacterium]|nr:hypothetical protein [Deltaproteobacteria bacterium]